MRRLACPVFYLILRLIVPALAGGRTAQSRSCPLASGISGAIIYDPSANPNEAGLVLALLLYMFTHGLTGRDGRFRINPVA